MDYEQNQFGLPVQPQTFDFQPERFFLNHRDLDFALVAVAPRGHRGGALEEYGWLPLNAVQGKIAITAKDYLNIIQHPLGREKEVVLRDNRPLDLAASNEDERQLGPFIHYEADTEKGSSGSPVFNDQWEVVALHHSGVPERDANGNWLNKDGEVWREGTQPVSEISWIANEGTRVSSLIAALTSARVLDHEQSLLDALLAAQPSESPARTRPDESLGPPATPRSYPAAVSPRRTAKREPGPRSDLSLGGAISFDVPLQVVIRLGGKERVLKTVVPPAGERDELLTEALTAADYVDRNGYDRNFLGVNVPFPTMKSHARFGGILQVPRPARPADKFELRYHRFSVTMNKVRRLAYVSACNVNFDPPSSVSRDEGTQSWRRDPRLDGNQQLGAPYYDDNDYDKGHLTRRDDAAWGSDKDDALAANWDTFHYTNAGPQHFLFNRSDEFTGAGLDLWGDLENHISAQGGQQRTHLSIFTGPIFGDNDKPLKDALVPLSYFKIIIWRDGNQTPGALGFVLNQDFLIEDLPEEAIDPGVFKIRQKRISRIQQDLDINFGIVSEWDQMPLSDDDESLDDGVLLTSVNDIVIARKR
jgi:endonuclease G